MCWCNCLWHKGKFSTWCEMIFQPFKLWMAKWIFFQRTSKSLQIDRKFYHIFYVDNSQPSQYRVVKDIFVLWSNHYHYFGLSNMMRRLPNYFLQQFRFMDFKIEFRIFLDRFANCFESNGPDNQNQFYYLCWWYVELVTRSECNLLR